MRANFSYPTDIRFGAGRIRELAEICQQVGIVKPLLITDEALAKLPIVTDTVNRLGSAGIEVGLFTDFKGNPLGRDVELGTEAFRGGGHDCVIAMGGGSALDVGKAVAFMAVQSRPLWDFEDIGDNYLRASKEKLPPVIAIPTTAGTGSEVGRASVITNEETHKKTIIFHPGMMPKVTLLDPELTVGLSPQLTAATGMDALAHCLEAMTAPAFHPIASGIAVEGVRLIYENLLTAYREPTNIEARGNMMIAATMGGAAFQKGLGAIHSMSHPLGALYGLHHGLLNGVVMPYVLVCNLPKIEEAFMRLAGYLQLEDQSFDGVLNWILELRSDLGIPNTLAELKVGKDRLDELVEMGLDDPSCAGNPVVLTEHILTELFKNSIDGNLEVIECAESM